MITTIDGVTKMPGESVWGISYNHDNLYESIEVIVEHDMHKSLSKCLYWADRNLCSEQVGLMNQSDKNI